MSYPGTERQNCGFAIRYLRWLSTSGAVNEIGPDAFALIVAVVLTEDEVFYQRAPNFFDSQLMSRCGIHSKPALIRAKRRAVNAGLLVYEPGAKRRPGVYFVSGNVSGFGNDSLPEAKRKRTNSVPNPIRKRNENDTLLTHTHTQNNDFFDLFWNAYPKKRAINKARQAFKKALKRSDVPSAGWLVEKAKEFAEQVAGKDPTYFPYPATWLDDGSFHDEPEKKQSRVYNPDTDGPFDPHTGLLINS